MKKTNVESFQFDHTKVDAPYIRQVAVYEDANNGVVSKYDIRLCQPNQEFIEAGAMHSIEHLVAENLRNYVDGVIDLSPMGCLTGFYFTVFGRHNLDEISEQIIKTFEASSKIKEVPAMNEKQCGNYRLHNPKLASIKMAEFATTMNRKLSK